MDNFRLNLLEKRRRIENRNKKEKAMVEKLLPFFMKAESIGAYIPVRGEADLFDGSEGYLYPRVTGPKEMVFASGDLKPGSFGIPEPQGPEGVPDLIIVPMLAFCGSYRMGYGSGFYDRWIAAHPEVCTVGVAFDEQECPFPVHERDMPLDWIITPTRIIKKSEDHECKRKYSAVLETV